MCSQISMALLHMQSLGIDHRDVKHLNILVFEDGNFVKLADFGLARYINSENTLLTCEKGTLAFMAPEARNMNPRPFISDMYSLGVVLHFMIARSNPEDKHVRT